MGERSTPEEALVPGGKKLIMVPDGNRDEILHLVTVRQLQDISARREPWTLSGGPWTGPDYMWMICVLSFLSEGKTSFHPERPPALTPSY